MTLIVNGEKYEKVTDTGNLKILNLPYGNNIVGRIALDDDKYIVSSAAVIRRWGTTRGLGEIANNGPTSETILDDCPNLTIHKTAVIYLMDCEEDKWDR
jgi:hypothetical protein